MNEKKKSMFLSLYAMVIADGTVHPKELEKMYRIGLENYQASPEEIDKWIVSAGTSFIVPEDMEDKVQILYHLAEIAWADGEIDETEKTLLCRYAKRLGFKSENASDISDYMLDMVHDNKTFAEVYESIINN